MLFRSSKMAESAEKKLFAEKQADEVQLKREIESKIRVGTESLLNFRQLRTNQGPIDYELDEDDREPMPIDTLEEETDSTKTSTYQLTGYTDPIYAEAIVENHYHTIIVSLVLINRTKKTLQNIIVETFIKEELKSSEIPRSFNLGSQEVKTLKIMFRANKTEDGFLFGYITYSSSSGNVPYVIPLDQIPLNLLDSVVPNNTSEKIFKKQWSELIWENKFEFITKGSPYNFLRKFAERMNLTIVSPLSEFDKTSSILTANLFGQTKFGNSVI